MKSEPRSFLTRYVEWMSQHSRINLMGLLGYYLAVVLPHKTFGTFLNTVVFQGITRDQYNWRVNIAAGALLLIYTGVFIWYGRRQTYWRWLGVTMLLNVILAIVALHVLFVINIEAIHFVQYAIFAIILFPLLKNYWQVLVLGVIAGAIDEAYQYFYLAPLDTSYYDFNDVITNLIGVVFGLLLLKSVGVSNERNYSIGKSPALLATSVLLLFVFVCWLMNILSIYPNLSSSYELVREFPTEFWSRVYPNVTYHVVLPLEGLMITGILLYVSGRLLHKQQTP